MRKHKKEGGEGCYVCGKRFGRRGTSAIQYKEKLGAEVREGWEGDDGDDDYLFFGDIDTAGEKK